MISFQISMQFNRFKRAIETTKSIFLIIDSANPTYLCQIQIAVIDRKILYSISTFQF